MKRIIPSTARKDEFIKCYYSNFFQLQKPLIAVAIKDINASNLLNTAVKSGESLIVKTVSLHGWCYVQIGEKFGYCQCMHLHLQQDIQVIQDIPKEYIMQFSPVIKKAVSEVSNNSLNKELTYTFVTYGFFKPAVSIETKTPKVSSKQKDKTTDPKKIVYGPCQECGINTSPEWRTGPKGKRSLCNACGLSWSKKKRSLKDGEKGLNHQNDINTKAATLTHDFPLSGSKHRYQRTRNKSKSVLDGYNSLRMKNPQVKKQKIVVTEEDSHKDSIPVNKSSLAFILS